MAGAMRKMAVYLGLVEDDGYDGPGFDPDDEFEPEPEPERDRRRHQPPTRRSGNASASAKGTNRYEWCNRPPRASRFSSPRKACDPPGSPPWHPSHLNARTWRRTHR